MRDAGHILLDDGAVVEKIGDIVAGGPDQLYPPRVRRVVGLGPGKCRQERVMDIDNCRRVAGNKGGRENLHVAGQNYQINPMRQK